MTGIKKTRTGWLIDVDAYTGRQRYYSGDRMGVVLRTTVDPTTKHNDYFSTVADMLIALYNDNTLPNTCTVWRRGGIVG